MKNAVHPIVLMSNELLQAIDVVQRLHNFWADKVERDSVPSDPNGLQQSLMVYYSLDNAYEALQEVTKKMGMLKELLSRKIIPEGMRNCNKTSDTIGRIKFSIATRTTASFKDKKLGYKWLRKIGEGALITETVNANTLSAFIRKRLEDTAESPPEFVKVNNMEYTKINDKLQ